VLNVRKSRKSGMLPGSLVYIGDEQAQNTKITMCGYDEKDIVITDIHTAEEAITKKDQFSVLWLDIAGLSAAKIISQIASGYGVHPLTVEDILNTEQLPKLDIFDHYVFVILRVYFYDEKINALKSDQIGIILGNNFIITVQERNSLLFDGIKERLKNQQSVIRKKNADYLIHALLDASVDSYYQVLESIGDMIDEVEQRVMANPTPATVKQIHALKRSIIFLRKSVWPLRETINGLYHRISPLIQDTTLLYLKDVYDHTVQVIDTVETYRDLLSGMMDVYISSINNKINEIMKVLTIFSTIFIPLTFISSLYGMNFNTTMGLNMPELNWRYGYVFILAIMLCVVVVMLLYFKRKKWL